MEKISDLTNKKTKSTNISEIEEDGVMLTDPPEVANSFNKFFSEIGPDLPILENSLSVLI